MNQSLTYSAIDQVVVLRRPNRTQEDANYYTEPCAKSILNVEKGTIFSRTPFGWLLLLLFYTCFYGSLCFLWGMLFWVFAKNLDLDSPRWYIQQPGLCMFPSSHDAPMQAIDYREDMEEEVDTYTSSISEALAKFGEVPNMYFGRCVPQDEYGYSNRQPCFYLKINRIINFEVEPYMQSSEMPDDAPKDLIQYINSVQTNITSRVWLWCVTNPLIKLEYYPAAFVSSKYLHLKTKYAQQPTKQAVEAYGSKNAKFYNTTDFKRMIAIKLINVNYNQLYTIRCSMWAKNIVRQRDASGGRATIVFTLRSKLSK